MRGAIFVGMGLLLSTAAWANDTRFQNGVLGDWSGLKSGLQDNGIQLEAQAAFELGTNASGGATDAATGANQAAFRALFDLDQLIGDDGGSLEAVVTDRFGAKLEKAAGIDTLMQIQEIYGRGDIWRLTQLSWAQSLFGGRAGFELGRMNPGSDFDVFACDFENLTFCGAPAGNIDGDYWENWPVSQWGGWAKANLDDTLNVKAGVYQISDANLKHGFTFDFGGRGVLVPFQLEWKPGLVADLPGDYQLGGWYSDIDGADVFFDTAHNPAAVTGLPSLLDHGRNGVYFTARQQVTGEAPASDAVPGTMGSGLSLFLNYTQSDRRTSFTDWQVAMGAEYKGALDSRPDDVIGLGFGVTHVNGQVALGQALSLAPVQHKEYVTEFDYRASLLPGVELTPNIQYIADPGGFHFADDILVLGLKGSLTL
jgi:porin